MAAQSKNVIVVGGSLGGLMVGLMLKQLGHNVKIFERSENAFLQDSGAGIVFGPEAQEYFSKHVKTDRALSVSSHLRQTLDRSGKVVNEDERRQEMVSWDSLYFILRAYFDGIESRYCAVPPEEEGDGNAKYEYGKRVTAIKNLGEGNGMEVEYESRAGNGKEEADLVIAADGPSSTIRGILLPEVKREYAGYVAWRGTVPENEASKLLKDTFTDRFIFFHGPGNQILAYLIPGKDGSVEPGARLINWVWYCNYPSESPQYKDLMTDKDGHMHHFSMPPSKIKPHLQELQRKHAKDVLAPAFSELVSETKQPFVQCITDVLSPKPSFFNGKLLLMGDAVAGFRPHTAASTSQAAYDALLLAKYMRGESSWQGMQDEMMNYARDMCRGGIRMGNRSQFESLEFELKDYATSSRLS